MHRRPLLLVVAGVLAAAGVTLVLWWAQGAQDRAEAGVRQVEVLAATGVVERGEPLEDALGSGRVAPVTVPADQVLADATSDVDSLRGRVALTTIYPGEQLIAAKVGTAADVESASSLPVPPGLVAIAVNLTDPGRVGDFVRPGSRVAVFVTGSLDDAGRDVTRLLLREVTVIGAGSTSQVTPVDSDAARDETTDAAAALPDTLLTIAVDQRQAEKVLYAQSHGELALALLPADARLRASDGVDATNLFN